MRRPDPLRRGRRVALAALLVAVSGGAHAQSVVELGAIVVEADAESGEAAHFDTPDARTSVGRTDIERRQARTVFEVLEAVPGVDISGSPRAAGSRVSIRGFSDNEDVLVRVDGATRNFEKYRYGSGLTLDPELLSRVDVQRGPVATRTGAGALGGAVEFRTRRASELLRGGQRFGGRARVGATSNAETRELSLSAYGLPAPWLDVLVAGIVKDSDDYALPSGERVENSSESQSSALARLGIDGDALGALDLSFRLQADDGIEPFDVTADRTGIGGVVRRSTREASGVARYSVAPAALEDAGLPTEFTLLYAITQATVDEQDAVLPATGTDTFEYDIHNFELGADSMVAFGEFDVGLAFGVQGEREARETRSQVSGEGRREIDQQPSGTKVTLGGYAEGALGYGDWLFTVGSRLDRVEVRSAGAVRDALQRQSRTTDIDFAHASPSARVEYNPGAGPLTLFYSFSTGFRAPLVDEYFRRGSLSRCFSNSDFIAFDRPRPQRPLREPGESDAEFGARSAAFANDLRGFEAARRAFADAPYANTNAICGDRYEPETAVQHEVGAVFVADDVFASGDRLSTRLVAYYSEVDGLLESIYENAATGEISQPGEERRRGLEFELGYDASHWFASLSLAVQSGEVRYGYFRDNTNEAAVRGATAEDEGWQPLNNDAGNSLNLTLGVREPGAGLEFGYRLRAVSSRRVLADFKPGCDGGLVVIPTCFETETATGYATHGLFASWVPNDRLKLDVSIDNLTDKSYRRNGFAGAPGTCGPGRDVRLSLRYAF